MTRLPWALALTGCIISGLACMLAALSGSSLAWVFGAGFVFCYLVMWRYQPRPSKRGMRELSQLDRVLSDALWDQFDQPEDRKEVWWDG